jgi:hypothetical protein
MRVKTQAVNRMTVIFRSRNYFNKHVAQMGNRRNACWDLVRRPDGKRPLARPGHRGRIILKWIFKKQDGRCGLDCSGSG